MAEPLTAAELTAALGIAHKTKQLVDPAFDSKVVRHGRGDPERERARCEEMHVYMRCIWNITSLSAKRRVILPRDATLMDARKSLELELEFLKPPRMPCML